MNSNKYFAGEVKDFQRKKGWFFGYFMTEKLLRSSLVEIAWSDISNKKPSPEDRHYHKNTIEINIVISGEIRLVIDNKKLVVKKGGFYVVYPKTVVAEIEAGENTELIVVRAPSIEGDKVNIQR